MRIQGCAVMAGVLLVAGCAGSDVPEPAAPWGLARSELAVAAASKEIAHLVGEETFAAGELRQVEGAYSLVALTDRTVIGVRDPLGVRPLAVVGKDVAVEDGLLVSLNRVVAGHRPIIGSFDRDGEGAVGVDPRGVLCGRLWRP